MESECPTDTPAGRDALPGPYGSISNQSNRGAAALVAAVMSDAASAVGGACVSAACNWAIAERVRGVTPSFPKGKSPTGATRMLAPHPLLLSTVASCHSTPAESLWHACMQV